jgi:hypothetical protein
MLIGEICSIPQVGSAMALPFAIPKIYITYFNPHFCYSETTTIFWFRIRKCGVFGSAFFFSTSCAEFPEAKV